MPRRVAAYVSSMPYRSKSRLSADLIWLRFEFEINLCPFDEFPQLATNSIYGKNCDKLASKFKTLKGDDICMQESRLSTGVL